MKDEKEKGVPEEKDILVTCRLSESINRKVMIYKGKYGWKRKEDAVKEIITRFFEDKEGYELEDKGTMEV